MSKIFLGFKRYTLEYPESQSGHNFQIGGGHKLNLRDKFAHIQKETSF